MSAFLLFTAVVCVYTDKKMAESGSDENNVGVIGPSHVQGYQFNPLSVPPPPLSVDV